MENQRKFIYLNKETREIINNLWKWHIHLSDSPDLRCAQNNRVEGYQSENRVQNKARWTQTEDFKAVRWFDNYYYQQNYNWPIMTIKKDHFPQHGRWLIRNRMSESGLKLHSLTLTPTVVAKQRMRTLYICFGYERASGLLLATCFLRRWNHDNGQLLWSKAKIYLWGTVPKISFTTGEKRCPSIEEIMLVCFVVRAIYARESNRRYTE